MQFDELVRRINDRDAAAIEDLLRIYGPAVRRAIICILELSMSPGAAEVEADDAVQELCMDLWRKGIGTVENTLPAKLFRMAHNKAVDRFRKGKYTLLRPIDAREESLPDRRPDPESLLGAQERLDQARELVLQLPPQDQQIVKLWLQDLSHAQIASLLGLPISTVKVRVHRAIKKMRGE